MNSRERLWAALHHQPVDRVPVNITYYMGEFISANFPDTGKERFEEGLDRQLRFGFDPLVGLGGAGGGRPWVVTDPGRWESREERVVEGGHEILRNIVSTAAGELSTDYIVDRGMSGWQMDALVKAEDDLGVMAYLPRPEVDIEAINTRRVQLDGRGLGMVSVNGIWQQACYLRGMEEMAMDPYVRPEWSTEFLTLVGDYLAAQAEAVCASQAECLFINESYVGMGLSPAVFDGFVRPYDQRLVDIGKAAGKLILYHDCGRCDALLESFVEMGIDYLEPLNPREASGDVDPVDAKRRIGDQVCLRGGYNHELLSFGTADEVRAHVRECLKNLSPGGGYMLCPSGPLDHDVRIENLRVFADAAAEMCGEYGTL